MQPEIHFKVLGPSDVVLLKELTFLFGDVFSEPESYQQNIPEDGYLLSLLGKDTFIAVSALYEGKTVGGLVAYVLEKFEQKRNEIYIYDLGVHENYRRKKIATGLINLLKEIARERKAWVIYVQADDGDEPAIKLYESLGVKEKVLHFDIKV